MHAYSNLMKAGGVQRWPQLLFLLSLQQALISLELNEGERAEECVRTAQAIPRANTWRDTCALKHLLAAAVATQGRFSEALDLGSEALRVIPREDGSGEFERADLLRFLVDCRWKLISQTYGRLSIKGEGFEETRSWLEAAKDNLERAELWHEHLEVYADILMRQAVITMVEAVEEKDAVRQATKYEIAEGELSRIQQLLVEHKKTETSSYAAVLMNRAVCLEKLEYHEELKALLDEAFLVLGMLTFIKMDLGPELGPAKP